MTVREAVFGLIKALAGSEVVVWADQNAPRPVLPYWTIRFALNRKLGRDAYTQGVTADGDIGVRAVREATVQVQRYGPGSVDRVAQLKDDLSRITVIEVWSAAKIALSDVGEVKDVPFKLDTNQLEPRAALDLFVRFSTELLDRVGIIEKVHVTAEYEESDEIDEFDANPV